MSRRRRGARGVVRSPEAAVRQLLEAPETSAGVRCKLALTVLRRPQFNSGRSWNLPVPEAGRAVPFDRIRQKSTLRRAATRPHPVPGSSLPDTPHGKHGKT